MAAVGPFGGEANDSADLRLLGAARALADLGLPYGQSVVLPCAWHREAAYELVSRLCDAGLGRGGGSGALAGVDGLCCLNDPIAIGALKALSDHGVSVPWDVAVIGFDGVRDGRYTTPGLTSVRIDPHEVAQVCLDLLVERIEAMPHARAPRSRPHGPGAGRAAASLPPRSRHVGFTIEPRGSAERTAKGNVPR